MGFHHSALIGFGGAGSAGLQDSAFPQIRSSGTVASTGSASNVACPYPATISADDILFIVARVTDSANLTSAVATGYTEVDKTGGGGTQAVVLLWKRADGTETGTIQVTISGGGGGTQTVWAQQFAVKNCITSGTPYLGNDTTTGGGPPVTDWVLNPVTTTVANSGVMHVCFVFNSSVTNITGSIGGIQEQQLTVASANYNLVVAFNRADTIGTYFNSTVAGICDGTGGGKSFFSMELLR